MWRARASGCLGRESSREECINFFLFILNFNFDVQHFEIKNYHSFNRGGFGSVTQTGN